MLTAFRNWLNGKPILRKLGPIVEQHFGVKLAMTHSVSHDIKAVERINLHKVVDLWAAQSEPMAQTFGYASTNYMEGAISRALSTDELIEAPVERVRIESGPSESVDCCTRAIFLLQRQQNPVALAFRQPRYSGELPTLEVLAVTREAARDTLTSLLEEARKSSIYKGRMLWLERPTESYRDSCSIRFQEVRPTTRDQIVLPEELLRVAERNIFGAIRHAAVMRSAGRSLRRGLLFHGPPGTGKTMMVRYLAGSCTDHTVIFLTGSEQGLIREACQIARMLAPSIVVLEDVDLVAEDRETNRCATVLHDLLNEMDGIGERDGVTFILTTNRADILEPALAGRPGRIDQAIQFPLPDENGRKRLFQVYGQGMDLSRIDLSRWVRQTEGVSPAFISELLRKALLMGAERGETSTPMILSDQDFHEALNELVCFGGELTQNLLGYRPVRIGYQNSAVKGGTQS